MQRWRQQLLGAMILLAMILGLLLFRYLRIIWWNR